MQRLKYFVISKNGSVFFEKYIKIGELDKMGRMGFAFERGYKTSFKIALFLTKKEVEEFKEELKNKSGNLIKVTKKQYQKILLDNGVKG